MDLRARIAAGVKDAMRSREAERLSTLRLISAAIKDRDIALRGTSEEGWLDDAGVLAILARMVKQRRESIRAYEEGGRLELADAERAEIAVIEDYLPVQLTEAEADAAIARVIAEEGATGIRDLGRVMAVLKDRHTGQMDFSSVGPKVKTRLE